MKTTQLKKNISISDTDTINVRSTYIMNLSNLEVYSVEVWNTKTPDIIVDLYSIAKTHEEAIELSIADYKKQLEEK